MLAASALFTSLASAPALGAHAITKEASATVTLAPGETRTVTVGYPDALEYGNASYSGRTVVLGPAPGAPGRQPRRSAVAVLGASSALGGSDYRVRVRNRNPSGTAPERVRVIAITIEPLPHS